ncbi:MAG: TipAS antibiotic-recognition domain-containing protein [Clostridia bacterium]|nr:TipAS antibiotic-recognition domain-containing protein [Clostridia bacterium]
MKEFEKYKAEAQEKWGVTSAYKEYEEKAKLYSEQNRNGLVEEMDSIMADFALCMKKGAQPDSDTAQSLVQVLKSHITERYYNCTDEILAGLGQMYVADERFRNNIDRHAEGTAEFIGKAIEAYCR